MPFGLHLRSHSPRRIYHRDRRHHHHHRPHMVVEEGPMIIDEEVERSRVRRSDIIPIDEMMYGTPYSREEIRSVLRQLRDGTRIEDVTEIRTRGYEPNHAYRMLERSMRHHGVLREEIDEIEEVVTHVHSPGCSARRIRNEIAREHAHAHAAAHAHALDMIHERSYPHHHLLEYDMGPGPMHMFSDMPYHHGVSYVPPMHAPMHRLI